MSVTSAGPKEDDLVPLSALQHQLYCPRQAALIHVERLWAENRFTAEGRVLHERAHIPAAERRRGVRTLTAVPVRSFRLGVHGVADVVELHTMPGCDVGREQAQASSPEARREAAAMGAADLGRGAPVRVMPALPQAINISGPESDAGSVGTDAAGGTEGAGKARGGSGTGGRQPALRPFPIDYKRGKPKAHRADEVQLCAQAMALEEMFGVDVPEGALFYGETRRRFPVAFDAELRHLTAEVAAAARAMILGGLTPAPVYERRKCEACSLLDLCRPKAISRARSVAAFLAAAAGS